ncbi:hypothetical protein EXIGLDRAFT_329262 [Exidia glandulosa HHB12029]|uniref:Uncharacterized protein n=1 Tax=Exidia glandulosa HHB12029 TaxID=1314781 RepID=A0A165CT13_EXIGL|nr:hypothetical protein EXIGLDRAFT_329262 [Exidia glandulosa HHB12029]
MTQSAQLPVETKTVRRGGRTQVYCSRQPHASDRHEHADRRQRRHAGQQHDDTQTVNNEHVTDHTDRAAENPRRKKEPVSTPPTVQAGGTAGRTVIVDRVSKTEDAEYDHRSGAPGAFLPFIKRSCKRTSERQRRTERRARERVGREMTGWAQRRAVTDKITRGLEERTRGLEERGEAKKR